MDWTEELIGRLRALWADGHSTAEIGRRLGVTKNAVVGKAHRLLLPPRPSPIRSGGPAAPRAPARRLPRVQATLPVLPTPSEPALRQAPAERPMLRAVPPPTRAGRAHPCCWPIGEPGKPSFRFCDAASSNGKPYCAEHAQLAYVKVRDRRDEAAA